MLKYFHCPNCHKEMPYYYSVTMCTHCEFQFNNRFLMILRWLMKGA